MPLASSLQSGNYDCFIVYCYVLLMINCLFRTKVIFADVGSTPSRNGASGVTSATVNQPAITSQTRYRTIFNDLLQRLLRKEPTTQNDISANQICCAPAFCAAA